MTIYVEDFLRLEGSSKMTSGGLSNHAHERLTSFVQRIDVVSINLKGQAVYAYFDDGDWCYKVVEGSEVEKKNSIVIPILGMMLKVFMPDDLDLEAQGDVF